jgi:hypothetical protein
LSAFSRLVAAKHTALRQPRNYTTNPADAQFSGGFSRIEYGSMSKIPPINTVYINSVNI